MTKIVKVYVVDEEGRGRSGQRVKVYGGPEQRTDSSGAAFVSIDGPDVSLYVNGFCAFEGRTSSLSSQERYSTAGRPM